VSIVIHILLLSGVIFLVAEVMPGIRLKSYGTAVIVAIVYSLIDVVLGTLLKLLSIPFIMLTLGFFIFLVNAFLLWLTDQLIEDFEIESFWITLVTAIIITLANLLMGIFY
jgi:putative membrane protein